ncbi:bacteriocin fulvocin C-related protein [Virgisporangium aurantiacum]|uniref:Uncharacterized protein n=1 Tax=Virgisporangium aurantiacum TaxID=175570 RepID=A0A8J3ZHQ5_9ACTN|nr:bacteriocin fulvocin C-related protein [Virgisporangium aurantiacum]GIJ63018.1 hypothetical protein Vau01_105340 [Virgisporangium aurantiacum]
MTISRSDKHWILAFNISCQKCRIISGAVAAVSGGKLEVLSLTHPDVIRWRAAGLGSDAPWAPTLIATGPAGEEVRAWTGVAMAVPMIRRLGLRSTLAVLTELGRLKRQEDGHLAGRQERRGLSRKSFLRLGAGTAVAVGLMVTGQTPAFAVNKDEEDAREWVAANRDRLPQTYDEVIARPLEHRKAIYQELPDGVRQELWSEQMQRYQARHPALTVEQVAVLDAAATFLAKGISAAAGATETKRQLSVAAINAFGKDQARALFATLGPASTRSEASSAASDCECYTADGDISVFCGLGGYCQHTAYNHCRTKPTGCSWWWASPCNGMCN